MTPWEYFWQIVGIVLAGLVMSFPYFGENYAFSLGERAFLGGTLGYTFFVIYFALRSSAFDQIAAGRIWLLVPVIIGLLVFTRLTRFRWLARYPVAIVSGIGLGLYFGLNLRAQIIGPVAQTISELFEGKPDPFSAVLVFVYVFTVPVYFLYSQRFGAPFHTKGTKLYYLMRLARVFMMTSFGYLAAGNLFGIADRLTNYIGIIQQTISSWPPA
jgi:hypothetical protein